MTCKSNDREVHLLGYFLAADTATFLVALGRLRANRKLRMQAIAEKLRIHSLVLYLNARRQAFPRAGLGRRHAALCLTRSGQSASIRELFASLLGDHCPDFVPKPRLDVFKAIRLIRGAGGVAVLAHPPYNMRLETLCQLAASGLGAIELAGPGIFSRLSRRFLAWANELQLVPQQGAISMLQTVPVAGSARPQLRRCIWSAYDKLDLRFHLRRAWLSR